MSLKLVGQYQLDDAWPQVVGMLEKGMHRGDGEIDMAQMRLLLVQGRAELVMNLADNGPDMAVVFQYIDHPNYRVAHIMAIGGIPSAKKSEQEILHRWLKHERGCSKLQACCTPAVARLCRRNGMTETYRVVRTTL